MKCQLELAFGSLDSISVTHNLSLFVTMAVLGVCLSGDKNNVVTEGA